MQGRQVQPRQIAIRASVSDVVQGEFIDRERDKKVVSPHGVEMKRVALVGFIVSKYLKEADADKKRFESVTIDDGTDTIQLKVFGEESKHMFKHVNEGVLVLVVGRVSKGKNSDEVFINPDFIKELTDPNFMSLHLLERYETILKRTGIQLPDTSHFQQMTLDSTDDDDMEEDEIETAPQPAPTKKKSSKPKIRGLAGEILQYIEEGTVIPDAIRYLVSITDLCSSGC